MEPSTDETGERGQPGPEFDPCSPDARARRASEEVRASLAAVKAARAAALVRMRRDTRRARAVAAVVGLTLCAGLAVGAGEIRALRRARAASAAAMTRPVAIAPAEAGVAESPGPSEPRAPSPPLTTPDDPRLACNEAYDSNRWRTAAEACARAFAALSHDPSLAMKVAQAQHARARYVDAGAWAHRAIALGGTDPDAFVILAHAEKRAGHPAAARRAYSRYLAMAPRGWHAREARAGVRASR